MAANKTPRKGASVAIRFFERAKKFFGLGQLVSAGAAPAQPAVATPRLAVPSLVKEKERQRRGGPFSARSSARGAARADGRWLSQFDLHLAYKQMGGVGFRAAFSSRAAKIAAAWR